MWTGPDPDAGKQVPAGGGIAEDAASGGTIREPT